MWTCVFSRAASTPVVMWTLIPRDLRRGSARTHTPQRNRVALLSNDVRRARLLRVDDAGRNWIETLQITKFVLRHISLYIGNQTNRTSKYNTISNLARDVNIETQDVKTCKLSSSFCAYKPRDACANVARFLYDSAASEFIHLSVG